VSARAATSAHVQVNFPFRVPRWAPTGLCLCHVAGQGLCLTGAHYSTLLKWHLGVPLLPADCAGRPCHLCGGPMDVFGDHAVACKKSGFGDRHLGIQIFFCQVLTQSRVPHDREVDISGN